MVANKNFQQAVNKALIRRQVLAAEGATRADLARDLGMYRSTVSNLTEVLLEEGWLREEGASTAIGAGRKGTVLAINPGKGLVAGLGIHSKGRYEMIFTDSRGRIISVVTGKSRSADLAGVLTDALNHADKEAGRMKLPVLGIGVSLSGPVDHMRQRIVWSEHYGLKGVPFAELVPERNYTVLVENDSQCCTWAKAWQTGNTGEEDFAYIYLNRKEKRPPPDFSVGLGIFLNGQAYHGAHRFAGELPPEFARKVIEQFRKKDFVLEKTLSGAAEDLLGMIQFLDPHTLYLGHHLEEYRNEIDSFFDSRKHEVLFDIKYAHLGENESSYGAACCLLNRIYEVPVPGPRPLAARRNNEKN